MQAVFLSVMVSIIVLIDHSTRGARWGNIKHAPRIRPIAPIRVLNPPKAKPPSKQVTGIPSSPSLDRDMGKLSHFV
jgi:hypothetical protein